MAEQMFDGHQRPPPPPVHVPQAIGFDNGFNTAPTPHAYSAAHLGPQPMTPILGAPIGHLDGWQIAPGSSDESIKNKWQTITKTQLVKSQADLGLLARQNNTSKENSLEAYKGGGGIITGMKRIHIEHLLWARNASEDPRFSWELAAIKPTIRSVSNPIATFFNPRVEITHIRVIMRKCARNLIPRPQDTHGQNFGPLPAQQHMNNPMGPHPGVHGPHPAQPMSPHLNRAQPGGMPRAGSPVMIPPPQGGPRPGGMAGPGNHNPMPSGGSPPGVVKLPQGGGRGAGMVNLGSGKGPKGGQSFQNDSDDDDFRPKRKSSNGRRSPEIVIPDVRDWKRGSAISSESDFSDDSDSRDSFRVSSPISSYSGGSVFSGGRSHGKSGDHKKSGGRRRSSQIDSDFRMHGHRPSRHSSRKDSFNNDDYVIVRTNPKHHSKHGSSRRHRAHSADSLGFSSRDSSPAARKPRLDDRPHRDRVELDTSKFRHERELRKLNHRIQDLEDEKEWKREQEREIDHRVRVAHREGRIDALEEERYHSHYYDRPRPLRRATTDRFGYSLDDYPGRRRYEY